MKTPRRQRLVAFGIVVACAVASILVGVLASRVAAAAVAFVTLLPWLSHVRWVGPRRAITEPSIVTIILIFYTFVFPLRGLAIAIGDYSEVDLVRGTVSTEDLITVLALASLGTAALVEAFHFIRLRLSLAASGDRTQADPRRADLLALLLGSVVLLALAILIVQNHGLAGTQARFLSHNKHLARREATDLALSVWAIFANPAVWSAAIVAVDRRAGTLRRVAFVAAAATILIAQLLVFGSRLNMLLGLTGVWVVLYYTGRSIPVSAVVGAALLVVVLSVPIVSQRPGGDPSSMPGHERYSRIAGYAVLDASLAVRQHPTDIRAKLRDSRRWLELPLYLVPSAIWSNKPTLDDRRMDVYVAQSLGDRNQQATGFPTGYVSELWLFAGWPSVALVSLLVGALAGAVHRKLVGASNARLSTSSLMWYCFAVTFVFNYYKDGDILLSIVGGLRAAMYLAVVLLFSGVWNPLGLGRSGDAPRASAAPPSPSAIRVSGY